MLGLRSLWCPPRRALPGRSTRYSHALVRGRRGSRQVVERVGGSWKVLQLLLPAGYGK